MPPASSSRARASFRRSRLSLAPRRRQRGRGCSSVERQSTSIWAAHHLNGRVRDKCAGAPALRDECWGFAAASRRVLLGCVCATGVRSASSLVLFALALARDCLVTVARESGSDLISGTRHQVPGTRYQYHNPSLVRNYCLFGIFIGIYQCMCTLDCILNCQFYPGV